MYKFVIPFLFLLAGLLVIGFTGWFLYRITHRVDRRLGVRDDVDEQLLRQQAQWSAEDIRRHRDRMNRNLDDLHGE